MLELIENIPFDAFAWPGGWVWAAGQADVLDVVQFTRRYACGQTLPKKLHISADNRYKLYINGDFEGLGPQCGCLERYFFDTYELPQMNECVITAVVWHDRANSPSCQISSRPGFFVIEEYTDGKMLRAISNWRCRRWLQTGTMAVPEEALNAGPGYEMTGFTIDSLCPSSEILEKQFESVEVIGNARNHVQGRPQLLMRWELHPRTILAMLAEKQSLGDCRKVTVIDSSGETIMDENLRQGIQSIIKGVSSAKKPVVIPANLNCRILLDTKYLVVGYPVLTVSGGSGSQIKMTYQEALQSIDDDVTSKGNRNEIDGRVMVGVTDVFNLHGKKDVILEPFWWRCWRYMELDIQTSDQAVELKALTYRSTGYPLKLKAEFDADNWFNRIITPGFRTMELCASETYMDCPYYERLQYIGDTRIQALLSYVLCDDDRLACEAIEMFKLSIGYDGLTQCSYPNRFKQQIPLFSLVYIAMLNDFLMWRGNIAFVQEQLCAVETILKAFERCAKDNGLIGKLPGWAFVDWTKGAGWKNGEPLAASQGDSFLVSFFYLYALQQAVNLYRFTGNKGSADRLDREANAIRDILRKEAFDVKKRVFVDEPSGLHLSQHTNIFAILTDTYLGVVDGQVLLEKILDDSKFAKATVYFKFYLFEAMYHIKRADLIWPELRLWHDMLDKGLTTFAETSEPSRSDCHGWSSHPLYHFIASILGIRPTAPGCSEISIRPLLRTKTTPPLPEILGAKFTIADGDCYVRLKAHGDSWDVYKKFPPGIFTANSMAEIDISR